MSDCVKEKLDEIVARVMSGLKDFQKATVDRVAELFENGVNRVLVSDEVGLGKTLIARGVIARYAQHRKKIGDDLVKVVYVCSNGAIAEQNLKKLKITDEARTENLNSSRLSMQHLNIAMQENDPKVKNAYIQLIPITPNTSFQISNSRGVVGERALMFAILRRVPGLSGYVDALETFLTDRAGEAWNGWAKKLYEEKVIECDNLSEHKYISDTVRKAEEKLSVKIGGKSLYELLTDKLSGKDSIGNTALIVKLRTAFSEIGIEKLEPDLVVMDEFQRFKNLLDTDENDETGMLARKFFARVGVKMLLLSATPYKMYSTLDEIEEENTDEHYREFLKVTDFLNDPNCEKGAFRQVWSNYSAQLKEFSTGTFAALTMKGTAENALYRHICRTERSQAKGTSDITDDSSVKQSLTVSEKDIRSYIQMQKLLNGITRYGIPIDYVKSCPYLLSFMRDYKIKRDIEEYFRNHLNELVKLNRETFFVKKKTVAAYEKIPPNNARLEKVTDIVMSGGAEKLLWIPPSMPYYDFGYPFAGAEKVTKTLIFSSWEMVPRMIASLTSYEAERKTIGTLIKTNDLNAGYFAEEQRRYPLPKLNFKLNSDDKPAAMSLFCLLYPSKFLSGLYDPIDCLNRKLSLKDIEMEVKRKISAAIEKLPVSDGNLEDKRWYYVAPILLDEFEYFTEYVFHLTDALKKNENDKRNKAYLRHCLELKAVGMKIEAGKSLGLGKMPSDLAEVLTDIAIASPANCAYRSYKSKFTAFDCVFPTEFARTFVNKINTPESTAVIELCYGAKNDDAFWQNVLTYCKAGNFQAMLDEYFHLLSNGVNGNDENAAAAVQEELIAATTVRATVYKADTLNGFKARVSDKNGRADRQIIPFRSHFSVAFTKGDGDEKDFDRKKSLRGAFNSPFRPFVLASTSIGQEGLDFHNYCRRIVHWNLPANPIDFEQREGRINRYECHAIRANIAKRYGGIRFKNDAWKEMSEEAKRVECTADTSELVPYWGLTESTDMVKIERVVPMYPFSKDEPAYERLIKILNLYRLTLGQARQEELIEYVVKNRSDCEDLKQWFINLSPYFRNKEQ